MIALASLEGWHITALDVKSAFLYGKLDEEIYMEQPKGFKVKGQETKVLRLHRALYGLRQAALAWWKELAASMKRLGFQHLSSDAGIFICKEKDDLVVAIVYVDDAMFFGKNLEWVRQKKQIFMDTWECHDLGEAQEFLRMHIKRKGKMIYLYQTAYLDKVLQHFGMVNAKHSATPLPAGYNPSDNKSEPDPKLRQTYQSVIRSLLYIMLGTRHTL